MITGGCLCGAVRYQAEGEPIAALHCHCRDCQRASGTGHVPMMVMRREQVTITGEVRGFAVTGGSGHKAIRHFCPTCGSLLFGTPEMDMRLFTISAGTLDDPGVFKPTLAQFTRGRPDWDRIAAPLAEHEAAAPMAAFMAEPKQGPSLKRNAG